MRKGRYSHFIKIRECKKVIKYKKAYSVTHKKEFGVLNMLFSVCFFDLKLFCIPYFASIYSLALFSIASSRGVSDEKSGYFFFNAASIR